MTNIVEKLTCKLDDGYKHLENDFCIQTDPNNLP